VQERERSETANGLTESKFRIELFSPWGWERAAAFTYRRQGQEKNKMDAQEDDLWGGKLDKLMGERALDEIVEPERTGPMIHPTNRDGKARQR